MNAPCGELRKEVDRAGLLDRVIDFAMQLSGNTCHTTWKNFSRFGGEFTKNFRIRWNQLLDRDVLSAAGHLAVSLTKIDTALYGLWLGHDN